MRAKKALLKPEIRILILHHRVYPCKLRSRLLDSLPGGGVISHYLAAPDFAVLINLPKDRRSPELVRRANSILDCHAVHLVRANNAIKEGMKEYHQRVAFITFQCGREDFRRNEVRWCWSRFRSHFPRIVSCLPCGGSDWSPVLKVLLWRIMPIAIILPVTFANLFIKRIPCFIKVQNEWFLSTSWANMLLAWLIKLIFIILSWLIHYPWFLSNLSICP